MSDQIFIPDFIITSGSSIDIMRERDDLISFLLAEAQADFDRDIIEALTNSHTAEEKR